MSSYKTLSFRITGAAPLLMHNSQMSDPLNQHSRLISDAVKAAKRDKTEASLWEVARQEWFGSLYVGEDGSPCLPAEMIEAVVLEGAKRFRSGRSVKAGLLVENNAKLLYEGPRDPRKLWDIESFRFRVSAVVGQNRVMRTRPRFDTWSADIKIKHIPELLDAKDIRKFLVLAGEQIGMGNWRPRFGRFSVG